jgi:RES domain-containing protein
VRIVWRLASGRHPPLTGEGARLVGGRWNSPGRPVVYTSESLALCLAECLVHITGPLPADYVAFKIAVPEEAIEYLDATTLKEGWATDVGYTRGIGDEWLRDERSLVLAVPSAVLRESINLLLNPRHLQAGEVEVMDETPFRFDPRLRPAKS